MWVKSEEDRWTEEVMVRGVEVGPGRMGGIGGDDCEGEVEVDWYM